MQLITKIEVRGFRSIQSETVSELGNLTCFVGKNSSGKSNVLRALNLFFNDVVEEGGGVDFTKDFHERPKSRRKKVIFIRVHFELPPTFKYRKGLEHLTKLGTSFAITRSWELDTRRAPVPTYAVECESEIDKVDDVARQFLNLVTYRYVPNRTVPSKILETESQALADSIFLRMKGDGHASALFTALGAASRRMLSAASSSLEKIGSPLSQPAVATRDSIGEMLTMGGFQALGAHGISVEDSSWGSGHQSFFLFQILHLLDTNYGRFFGWKQATIWGIEEPESGLHRDLETQLAAQFREWADNASSRLQILQTTHSAIFSMASDKGYWVELKGPETKLQAMPLQELAVASETKGVTGWMHPALSFPWNPVVLVEGGIDCKVLNYVAEKFDEHHLRFLTVKDFEDGDAAGKDAMTKWLRRNNKYIANRPLGSPLIAVFDWEVSDAELQAARVAYGKNGAVSVFRMNKTYCAKELGADVKGVERFYPPSVFHDAHAADECTIGVSATGLISISKAQLDGSKSLLLKRFLKITDKTDLAPLQKVLADIVSAINGELGIAASGPA